MPEFKEVTIGPCRLINADCMEVLPSLSGVDTIITSPPYNLGTTTGGGFPQLGHYSADSGYKARGGGGKWRAASQSDGIGNGYESHDDAMPHEEYVAWQHQVLLACWSTLSDSGAIFYNHKPRVLSGRCVTPLEYNPNLPLRQIVIWARAGGINFSPAFYVPTHEWITIFAKESWRLKSKGASGLGDVWRIPQQKGDWHPCAFPAEIPDRILESTKPGLVVDPFLGSGTVAKSCIRFNRPFIGIEKSPEYFEKTVADVRREFSEKKNSLFPDEELTASAQRSLFEEETI